MAICKLHKLYLHDITRRLDCVELEIQSIPKLLTKILPQSGIHIKITIYQNHTYEMQYNSYVTYHLGYVRKKCGETEPTRLLFKDHSLKTKKIISNIDNITKDIVQQTITEFYI